MSPKKKKTLFSSIPKREATPTREYFTAYQSPKRDPWIEPFINKRAKLFTSALPIIISPIALNMNNGQDKNYIKNWSTIF